MTPEELARWADLVADGADADGARPEAPASGDPADQQLADQFEVLRQLARLHRTLDKTPPAGDPVPRRWGHLVLRERIGAGTYGEVYRAWDPQLQREVALKLIGGQRAGTRDTEVVEEARLLARVRHPNVITVHGADSRDGVVGLWMEFVDGASLGDIVRQRGPFSADEAVLIGATLCRAVAAVHRAGLLHRDIKADNVVRERGGRLVLMDFGTSREHHSGPTTGLELAGTPLHLAPELFQGQPASVQSDIYALGVLVYYALTGDYPITGPTLEDLRNAHREGRRVRLQDARPDTPAHLDHVLQRALAPRPENRYASAGDMGRALLGTLAAGADIAPAGRETASSAWRRASYTLFGLVAAIAGLLAFRHFDTDALDFTVRRVTFRLGRVVTARFAPDARTVLYGAQWGEQARDVYVSGFDSLESRTMGYADASVLAVSTKGELALQVRPRFLRGYQEAGTLATVAFGGGTPRELQPDVQEADWSSDGTALAIVRDVKGTCRLEFPIGTVLYETTGWISSIRVSRDGHHVAFIDHPTPADDSGYIAVVDRTRTRRYLTPRWVSVQGLAWSSSGEEVWFTGTTTGNRRAIYAADLSARVRVVGRMLSNIRLHDVSRDGKVLLTEENVRVGVMARAAGDQRERELSWLDWSIARDVSGDGQFLLLNESGEGGGGGYGVYLRRLDGTPAVRLADGSGLALSPDNLWVLATHPELGLQLLPTGSGQTRRLKRGPQRYQQWGDWFPDGRRVLYAGVDQRGTSRIYVQDVGGGDARPITGEGVYLTSSDALSPDATRVAAVAPDQFATLYPVDGGTPTRVPGTAAGEVPIHWTPDGRSLFIWQRGQAPARVRVVDVRSGRGTPWKELMPPDASGVHEILRIVMSDDARSYAYSYTRELSTLHVVDGLK